MIRELEIKNYQSLEDVKLELAPFTVVVGRSSSGKSALTRALKALASNQTGKDFITHGQSTSTIKATTDKGTLVLTKGKEDSYVILSNEDPKNPRKYTKLGVGVPEDVSSFLGIPPKEALNFAGQFDMPYLLRTSAAQVASTLGELTNVSSIFEAAREGNRRKLAASSTLKTREIDLQATEPKLQQYATLEERAEALTLAEHSYKAAVELQGRIQKLDDLVMTLKTAAARLKAAQGRTAAALPDTAVAEDLLNRKIALEALVASLRAHSDNVQVLRGRIAGHDIIIEETETLYHDLLVQAGQCPMCGQSTKGLEHAHA